MGFIRLMTYIITAPYKLYKSIQNYQQIKSNTLKADSKVTQNDLDRETAKRIITI